LRVQAIKRARVEVTADGDGVVGHAGALLLSELADRLGLPGGLDRWAGRGQPERVRHRSGRVLTDLAVMLADGGDCLSDLAALRDQPEVFGQVASTPTAWRVLERLAQAGERGLAGVRLARARARARAWRSGAWVDGPLLVDLDATLITAHSDKQGAEGTYKHGFGFHPLGAWLDRGDGTGEPLAAILRPGNAGANTAADHIQVLDLALAQLPREARQTQPILVRSWSAPTRPVPPTRSLITCASVGSGSRSGSTWTSACPPRSWPCLPTPGSPQPTPTATTATARRSPNWPAWTWPRPGGQRARGRSAAANAPTRVPS